MAFMTPEERDALELRRSADANNTGRVPAQQVPTAGAVLPGSGAAAALDTSRPAIGAQTALQDQVRAKQQALIDQLHGIATGAIKSPAMQAFEQQVTAAQSANMGVSGSLRDVGPGGQAQIAQQNAGKIQGRGIEQGAILQAQQKQAAEQALAQLYQDQRQGDLGQAGINANAQLGNQSLDDLLGMNTDARNLNTSVQNTNRRFNSASNLLGISNSGLDNGDKLAMGVGAAATAFDYLGNAVGGNKKTPSLSDLMDDK